ncbi:transferase [Mycobacteroides abscessus subsp. bolletii]|uniref:glycosyltransferase family 9 protein n=1 Tax=Mycobacteroides abscessus TaxID=36809 RepID=UPI0009A8CEB3|nr:transferase [Mycobacteroides abscessus subsp. bolletii]
MALAAGLPSAPHRILVLRALGLGDLLTGIPALRALRRRFPRARLTLAAPERFHEMIALTHAVDELLPTPGLGPIDQAGASPCLAVNMHGRGPESIAYLAELHPKYLLSHSNSQFPAVDGPPWRSELHEVDRWCALLGSVGIDCEEDDLGIERPGGYPDRSGVVVIHPGAAYAARRWPADRFAEVARRLSEDGHEVVITGSGTERTLACQVATEAGLPESAVCAGTMGLGGLTALINDCKLLICGDTGVGHLATATGTPSVLLFGPTPPANWGPRGAGRHTALWVGDRGDPHGATPDAGLLLITVRRVLEAARARLEEMP